MTERERFIAALEGKPLTGHVPHFELVFFLTMESIGKVHPSHRNYSQWYQMSMRERELHLNEMAEIYVKIADKYNHSAIFVHPNPGPRCRIDVDTDIDATIAILEKVRELAGDKYFIMIHGDCTHPIPNGDTLESFVVDMYEHPDKLHEESKHYLALAVKLCDALSKRNGLIDGFALCSDYCFNVNPFFSLEQFQEFIKPYLKEIISYYKSHGYYTIKHTDGNIMPILPEIIDCAPDAIHSLDPQGGVSLREVKQKYGKKVCLIGNVNCGLLQTGTEEELIADTRRALQDGMSGPGGYIFSTSNCAFTGLPLERYELMHRIWKEEGIYPG